MDSVEERILSLYRRVRVQAAEWAESAPLIARAGFRILCGPPIVGAPMVVSLNPGYTDKIRQHDRATFWPERWPERLEWLRGISAFARRLGDVLQEAGIKLDRVNGGYVVMFRCNNMDQWKTEEEVPADVRRRAEDLSLEVLHEINAALKPKFVYAAGFDTFKRMGCSLERREDGRRKSGGKFELLRFGDFGGVPVIASPHLSGYRLSRENDHQIAEGLSRLYHGIA